MEEKRRGGGGGRQVWRMNEVEERRGGGKEDVGDGRGREWKRWRTGGLRQEGVDGGRREVEE